MRHLIYLDAHFIDYLWDFRDYIWEGHRRSLRNAIRKDRSLQAREYEALAGFPDACWMNHWHLVVGQRAYRELKRIRLRSRRKDLLDYATQLVHLTGMDLCGTGECTPHYYRRKWRTLAARGPNPLQMSLPGLERPSSRPATTEKHPVLTRIGLEALPVKDRPLVEDALLLGCDVFLTTDRQLLRHRRVLESQPGFRIRRLTEFLNEEDGEPSDLTVWPDLLLYTGLMPGASW